MTLDAIQVRVLGALIEKEIATPENYPLSLNALLNACNQRSSRDPVLDLTEDEVRQAVHSLEEVHLVSPVRDARVPKYEHRARTVWNLRRDETAVLCLLMLRGPQTTGELRSRADRLFTFDDLAAVQATLERLAARTEDAAGTGPLTKMLPRQPGARESRYAHLLSRAEAYAGLASGIAGSRAIQDSEADAASDGQHSADRLSALEAEMQAKLDALGATVEELRDRIAQMEANFSERRASQL
ncbi:MAG: DUF480 domain-containing protein [Acidobacteria bacterium]|nr:DUF480 domain-containing protein [Acidobacteriota bacterium]